MTTKTPAIPDDPLRNFLRRPAPASPAADIEATAAPVQQPASRPPLRPSPPPVRLPPPRVEATLGPLGGRSTITTAGKLRKTVYFTPEQWGRLQELARHQGTSYSDIVATALAAYLER